ncbi:hypothetical protein AAE02nite_10350 [Adhaeribacter aerolatus]|uniref:Uncharacterized protein n=1 Tax=Adhaeribacter aerolatus TaxID=670289 RepID=A0A512AUI7_9BACT|nr:hypothetical protein [Adhaeribacter aerolatus]GEO03371.1 hypothetical protein AAE02nite_10350 [Adhaeribacter aerolatus]
MLKKTHNLLNSLFFPSKVKLKTNRVELITEIHKAEPMLNKYWSETELHDYFESNGISTKDLKWYLAKIKKRGRK